MNKEICRADLRRDYETYLRRQRGLSERTIFHSWRIADRFLEFRFGKENGELSRITTSDIVGFLQHLTTRTPPLRDKTLSSHLRNFFRYLFKAGKTATNLALAIPSVAQRYGTRLPRHLTTEQVEMLVRAVRTDAAGGRRNYAMVMLLARLGLRGPEVIAMQIDDIDWRSGEVIVRGKGNRHDRVPLPPDVGEALADYIKSDRKTSSRALFVTERAPHRPFKNAQLLTRCRAGSPSKEAYVTFNSKQCARREPLYDIDPQTGVSIEVFYADRALETFSRRGAGWFWWFRRRGFSPNGSPTGPFAMSYAAYRHALNAATSSSSATHGASLADLQR